MNTQTTTAESGSRQAQIYIGRVLSLLCEPGSVVELRCLRTQWITVSGYFNDFEKLARYAAELSGTVPAVYITLNPVNSALLARANNRIEKYAKTTTGDSDIVKRRWLPIDFDPVRPTDISSTDAEKALAMDRAKECAAWLRTLGFPAGVFGDSGNGGHLLYSIDLPNDTASTELVKKCLEAAAARFTDDKVSVDLKNFNAARIWKLYGTMACKGDNMADRPHRRAEILNAPKQFETFPLKLLQKLAALAPESEKLQSNGHYRQFDLDDFIARHDIPVKRESAWNGGRRIILEVCPWNSEHNHGEAYIVQIANGAIGAGCQHNSCSQNKWQDLREKYEPGCYERRGEQITGNSASDNDSSVNCYPLEAENETIAEPEKVPFPETAWQGPFAIWRDIVCPATESPQEYLWASCLTVLGLMIGRNAFMRNPRALYPNFYTLILGQTGDDRKSTALDFAKEALFSMGLSDQVHTLHGIQSSEAIYDSLGRADGAKTLAYIDEFRSLLSVSKRKGSGEIIPRLGTLYYCPRTDSLDRTDGNSTTLNNPFLSLITATPMEYIQDLLGSLELDGGFLNRFLTITGKVQGWKAIARPPARTAWDRFNKAVHDICTRYREPVEFGWCEAEEQWTEFYTAWKTKRQDWNIRDQKLTARIDEHITKLALVYSAIRKQSDIDDDALATAIRIGKYLQATALNAFTEVGLNFFSKAEKTVLDTVKSKKKMYRRYLQQWVYKKGIDGDLLDRVIRSLVKNGHLAEGKDITPSGRERPWVEYIPTGSPNG